MLENKNDIIGIAKNLTKEDFLNEAKKNDNHMGLLNGYYECPFGYDMHCPNICDHKDGKDTEENCKQCWKESIEYEKIHFKDDAIVNNVGIKNITEYLEKNTKDIKVLKQMVIFAIVKLV